MSARIEAAAEAVHDCLIRASNATRWKDLKSERFKDTIRLQARAALTAADRVSLAGTEVAELIDQLNLTVLYEGSEEISELPTQAAAALAGLAGENARLKAMLDNPGPAFFDNAWNSPVALDEHDWPFLVSLLAVPESLPTKELKARWAASFEAFKAARAALQEPPDAT